jgi:hypothetical protein
LNIAESMLLGKPVVVTGWSGNMDFTTDRNACLVDYSLVTLERSYGPYPAGSSWAEPNLDHAASLMMRLVGDREFREKLATRGQSTVAAGLSPRAIGARYERRFNHLMRHLHQPGSSRSNKMSRWRLP